VGGTSATSTRQAKDIFGSVVSIAVLARHTLRNVAGAKDSAYTVAVVTMTTSQYYALSTPRTLPLVLVRHFTVIGLMFRAQSLSRSQVSP